MLRHLSSTGAFVLVLVCYGVAWGQFEKLISRVPNDANTIMLVDVAQLREGLADRTEYSGAAMLVPRDVARVVTASKMDFARFEEVNSMAAVELTHEPSFPKLVAAKGGSIDHIEGKEVAVLPGDAFIVRLGPKHVVAGVPAVRQDVVRFLRSPNRNGRIHEYLKEAEKFAERGSQIIMAMDLGGVVSAEEIRQKIDGGYEPLPEGSDVDAIVDVLTAMRGISLGVKITNRGVFGAVKVDFEKEVTPLKPVAKEFLLRALEEHGAAIDEFHDWNVKFGNKAVQLSGQLGPSGMLRLMSLLEAPPELRPEEATAEDDEEIGKRLTIAATQSYFKTVRAMLDDLTKKRQRSKTSGQIGVWYRRYAKKINELPMQYVDRQMLECGMFVAKSLRQGSGGITQAAARSRVRQNAVSPQYDTQTWSRPVGVAGGSYWSGPPRVYTWNGWRATPNPRRRGQIQSQIRQQERIKGYYAANLALQQIEEALHQTRYELTLKYDANF